MRTLRSLFALAAVVPLGLVLLASSALAQINYGDFLGTGVDFLQVTETTNTAGDAAAQWDAPSLGGTGDQLLFFPTNFVSECNAALPSADTTSSTLTTTVTAQPGVHIEILSLQEAGDILLIQSPPFGDPGTNGSIAVSGTVTVTETTSGPIAPVVIPFVGTFVPSDTFALPTNFGTSTWTGDISVDVASVVPLATSVDVAITNVLSSNCSSPTATSRVQKKSVSGPAVALMVNPLQCDIDVDKTCCVTRPALPDLGQCEGQMVEMTLEYTGDSCRRSNNDQGRSFKCYGRRRVGEPADITILKHSSEISASPDMDVMIGDLVTFSSNDGTLRNRTKFKVKSSWWRRQYLKINTSCNKAFQCGDQFGAFKVVAFESTLGGVVDCQAPPGPPVCAGPGDPVGTQCDDKLLEIEFEYNGRDCQDPLANPQGGYAACSGDATGASNVGIVYTGPWGYKHTVAPASGLNDGDRFRVSSSWWGGLHWLQQYRIVDTGGVLQSVDVKVSCSQPLGLGDEFGSLKVVGFTTKSGLQAELGDGTDGLMDACEVPLAPPGPHCTSDLQELTLVYIGDFLGEGCTVSNSQYGFGTCSGVDDPGASVSVVVNSGQEISPEDMIEFGDLVTITADDDGDLTGLTNIDVTGDGGTQWIQIKTSCHKPLSLGDRFGSFVVFGMDREDDGPITLGGNVQYQYTVTNPNGSDLDNVTISDDQLGIVASGLTIGAGESTQVVIPATLLGTTTNVATVSGDVGGDVCDPGVDQVTVTVTAPPQGSFSCSEPITELSLIWNGAQTVDVKVWEGPAGTSTQLHLFENVAPGDAIVADGLGADYPTYEIFDETGTIKLGESSFDLWCNDWAMNGLEDCGKNLGNLKTNDPTLINDWLLEGMVDTDETLMCTPGIVPAPPDCGFGPELLLVLPGLMLLQRRRMRKA